MATKARVSTLLLRHIPLFATLPENQLAMLTGVLRRRTFPRDTTIIATGEISDFLYVVISGRLRVQIGGGNDRREVILSILGPNEYFGDLAAIDEGTESASVIALEPCELLMMSKLDFRQCLSESFELTSTVMRCLVHRVRLANSRICNLAVMDAHERVAHLLQDLSEPVDGRQVLPVKVLQKDIAKMIGASRETVNRIMKDLCVVGFIELRGHSIYLRNNIASIG